MPNPEQPKAPEPTNIQRLQTLFNAARLAPLNAESHELVKTCALDLARLIEAIERPSPKVAPKANPAPTAPKANPAPTADNVTKFPHLSKLDTPDEEQPVPLD